MSRKFALIIGNSQYDDANLSQLTAPAADVLALDELLRAPEIGGFDSVQTLANRPFDEAQLAIADFFADKKPGDLLLLYFSGHGLLDPQGRLYLAVKNTRNDRLSGSAIGSLFLKDEMDNSRAKRQVLILDCCQSGAFGQGAKGAPGAQAITDATFEGWGRVVLTATDKTQPAWEGNRIIGGVETSIFTHFIVEGLKTGAAADEGGRITPTRLYDYVFPKVVEAAPTQKPRLIVYDREGGDIVIARSPRPPAPKPAKLPPELQGAIKSPYASLRAGAVEELTRLLQSSDRALALAAGEALTRLKDDDSRRVSELATKALAELALVKDETRPANVARPADVTRPTKVAAQKESAQKQGSYVAEPPNLLVIEHPFHLELIRIPAGEFLMGSDPAKDKKAWPYEQPQHRIYVSEFYISKYPVTNAQYAAFKKIQSPSGKEDHPVVRVSWNDAVDFCKWLNKETGQRFRLPTEAEWEKAARGTDGRIYPWGNKWDAKRLNSNKSKIGGTTPVGQYSPAGDSPYGVADMSGNVCEWCADWRDDEEYQRRSGSTVKDPQGPKTGTKRVFRGGSWDSHESFVRIAARLCERPHAVWPDGGFRVAAFPG